VDLFREVQVEYRDRGGGLPSLYQVELIKAHDQITARPQHYLDACDAAAFLLRNSQPGLPSPEVFTAWQHILTELEQDQLTGNIPRADLIRLVYLDEHGLLPERLGDNRESEDQESSQQQLLQAVLAAAMGKREMPELDDDYWQQLGLWIKSLCHFHGLE